MSESESGPEHQDGAGIPDGFQRLWTPHRLAYIKGENKPAGTGEGDGCPFCRIPALSDEDGLIVARGQLVYSILNLYPYNAGHLMVLPYRHVADYTDLDAAAGAVSFRYRSGEQDNGVPVAEAIDRIIAAIEQRVQV